MTTETAGRRIFAARRSAHLDEALFGRLAEIDPRRLRSIEGDEDLPTPAELDRCARVFGSRVDDLLAGEARRNPVTLLLRSAYDEGGPSLLALAQTGAHRMLGEFQRCVADVADLEDILGDIPESVIELAAPSLPRFGPVTLQRTNYEAVAVRARLRMGLGLDPIRSMRSLLAERGVRVFWTAPPELTADIDGACTHWPRPAILVNLSVRQNGEECWWRSRMTMAHELAHLLFHERESDVLLSPRRRLLERPGAPWRWRFFEGFADIEVQADAFAACFLAPAESVRAAVVAVDPTTEEAIGIVGARFGVGRTVAINRLQAAFRFSDAQRLQIEARPSSEWIAYEADFEGDRIGAQLGLRHGELVPLVSEALRLGRIDKVRAWAMLDTPLTEPLPVEGVPLADRAPVVDSDAETRVLVLRSLLERYPSRPLLPTAVRPLYDGWEVEVVEGGVGAAALVPVGTVTLSRDGRLVSETLQAEGR